MVIRLNFLMKSDPTLVDLSSVFVPAYGGWDNSFEFSRIDFDAIVLKLIAKCNSPYSTIVPDIRICTGIKADAPYFWRLRLLVPYNVSVRDSTARDTFIEEYKTRLTELNSVEGVFDHGFNVSHLNRPTVGFFDQRNVIWIDTKNLTVFSYNKGAIRHLTANLYKYVQVIAGRYNLDAGTFAAGSVLDQMQSLYDSIDDV